MGLFGKRGSTRAKTRQPSAGENIKAPSATGPRPSKTVASHPCFGEVTVARNPRAKRVSISVRPPGTVRLTLPVRVSTQEGMRFLDSKHDWIVAALERARVKSPATPISPPYRTRSHSLELQKADIPAIKVRIADGHITVVYPRMLEYSDADVQAAIKKGIEEAWRIEAKQSLPRRTTEIAQALGFSFNSVSVRNTVSKWGSCSSRNDISLSLHLMRLPDELVDYIIIHELCHTVHKNHGPQFHALLDRHTAGRHRELRKQLLIYTTRW